MILLKQKLSIIKCYIEVQVKQKGTCMFIRDKLYNKAINYLRMGIKLPKHNADIVGISAYSSLVCSGIVGKVKINPKNILVLKDVDRYFNTNVISVEIDENKHCIAKAIKDYKLKIRYLMDRL